MLIPPILAPLILTNSSSDEKTIPTGNDRKKLIQISPDDGHHDSFDDLIELDYNKVGKQVLIEELRSCGNSRVFKDRKDIDASSTLMSILVLTKFRRL
ncbi:4138_t:CDS:2 [Acaulospora morrowiae]|uniref:4138_t:CDS:1 n=1 Tax=Acaulospora morrowiae TaxID=94023 RepID=A0A9N9AS77_9GLOM|nr:4138_t:CDS:2 [Acaulospora morrowiae]